MFASVVLLYFSGFLPQPRLLSVSGAHFPQARDVTSSTALTSQSGSVHSSGWMHSPLSQHQWVKNLNFPKNQTDYGNNIHINEDFLLRGIYCLNVNLNLYLLI